MARQKKLKILSILYKYKNTLRNLVNNLDIKFVIKQINLPSKNILGFKDSPSCLKVENDFSDKSQGQQQCLNTPSPIWGPMKSDKKAKREKSKSDKQDNRNNKKKVIRR